MSTIALTYRQTSPNIFRVSTDGEDRLDLRAITQCLPQFHLLALGIDIRPLMDHDGDIEPPGGFEDALKAFKDAFTRPADVWRENLEDKRAGAERWKLRRALSEA
jgi:hypothetical protein